MKLSDTNACEFCGEIDYVEHALVSCIRLRAFWEAVLKWTKREVGIEVKVKLQDKLFGIEKGEHKEKLKKVAIVNQIILIAKFSIFKTKYYDHQNIAVIFEEEISKRKKYLQP